MSDLTKPDASSESSVSGEPKTLWEMTPREAWEHAWEQAIDTCRVFEEEATAGRLEVVRSIGRQFLDQDAGVPVVARDEAAELRAAIAEWVAADAAYSEWMVLPVREDWTSGEAKARKERLEAAEANLRRLAGGENEK